jgi:hypothetical protein
MDDGMSDWLAEWCARWVDDRDRLHSLRTIRMYEYFRRRHAQFDGSRLLPPDRIPPTDEALTELSREIGRLEARV